jgi:hypothetical protein
MPRPSHCYIIIYNFNLACGNFICSKEVNEFGFSDCTKNVKLRTQICIYMCVYIYIYIYIPTLVMI